MVCRRRSGRRSGRKSKKRSKGFLKISSKIKRRSKRTRKTRRISRKSLSQAKKMLKRLLQKQKDAGKHSTKSEKKFTVYTLNGCRFCEDAKQLLKKNKKPYAVFEYMKLPLTKQKQISLKIKEQTGKSYDYFPKIFSGDKFIGGFTELKSQI